MPAVLTFRGNDLEKVGVGEVWWSCINQRQKESHIQSVRGCRKRGLGMLEAGAAWRCNRHMFQAPLRLKRMLTLVCEDGTEFISPALYSSSAGGTFEGEWW